MSAAPRSFTDRVLAVVASLAAGEVVTYGEVAAEADSPGAARAVGQVMRQHGAAVAWWRVVPASGRLVAHLAEEQGRRLAAEGVEVRAGRVVRTPIRSGARRSAR